MIVMRTLGIIALGLMLLVGGGMLLTGSARANASMAEAFDSAINGINQERAKNRANDFDCTQFFSEFYRAKKIDPYIAFLKSRGVRAIATNANQRPLVSFEITSTELGAWGNRDFYRGDRLVLVFATKSLGSEDVTSFAARCYLAAVGRGSY